MANLDYSKIWTNVLAQQQPEKKITEYKTFYKNYLSSLKNRQEAISKLYPICLKFQSIKPDLFVGINNEIISLEIETKKVLEAYFNPEILKLYKKEIPIPKPRRELDPDCSFLEAFLKGLSITFETLNELHKKELSYKANFLNFLYNCLVNFGLHPDILRRDEKIYKRYNFVLEHDFKSKTIITEHRILLKSDTLQQEYLTPYERKLPIKIKGKLIPFKKICSIQISSTLLLDDEIELFSKINNFTWNNLVKEERKFIALCKDETETLHKNPYLLEEKEIFRNQYIYFVHPNRLQELKAIKSKTFDLSKLVRLCEELNNASANKNIFSSSLLVRSIIDHIPPIFEFKNFSSFANNYADGTKSFKKSMLNLDNSLRNIADNNIHSQVRKKEALPTISQTDFTPELDLLLSEIVRKLK